MQAGNPLKVLNIGCNNGQFVMQGCRCDPEVIITHSFAADTQSSGELGRSPGDLAVEDKDAVGAQAKPAVLLLVCIESLRKLAHANDANVHGRVWVPG
jgi:hypothetical protein